MLVNFNLTKLKTNVGLLCAMILATLIVQTSVNAAGPSGPLDKAIGHFQSRNVLWGLEPEGLNVQARATGNEGMHYSPASHSQAEPFMSTSFFPVTNLQIADLYQLEIQMYLTEGSVCSAGSPRITMLVANAEGNNPTEVFAYFPPASCENGKWTTLNFIRPTETNWAAGAIGGSNITTQEAAHAAAKTARGDAYKITVIRFNFDGGSGPDAWFDNKRINGLTFTSRFQDFANGQNAEVPEAPSSLNALVRSTPVSQAAKDTLESLPLGFYQAYNVRWNLSPTPLKITERLTGTTAMHFAPHTHPDTEPYMSTSFFPQNGMQLKDLNQFNIQLYPVEAAGCVHSSPVSTILLVDENDENTKRVLIYWDGSCAAGKWTTVDFMDSSLTSWAATEVGGSNTSTLEDSHAAAIVSLGENYSIQAIRVNYDTVAGDEIWLDNQRINNFTFTERVQDWSENSLLLDE